MHSQKGFRSPKRIDKEFLPDYVKIFTDQDSGRLNRENVLQRNLRELAGNRYERGKKPVSGLYAISESYSAYAPKDSRRSTMSLMAKINGRYYPTNAVLDPFWRAPVLGEFEDPYDLSGSKWEQDEDEPEIARGNLRKPVFKPRPFVWSRSGAASKLQAVKFTFVEFINQIDKSLIFLNHNFDS